MSRRMHWRWFITAGGLAALATGFGFSRSTLLGSSVLLASACLLALTTPYGIRKGIAAPVTVLSALYLASVAVPSLTYALGWFRPDDVMSLFFKPEFVVPVGIYTAAALALFVAGYAAYVEFAAAPLQPPPAPFHPSDERLHVYVAVLVAPLSLLFFYISAAKIGAFDPAGPRPFWVTDVWTEVQLASDVALWCAILTTAVPRTWRPRWILWLPTVCFAWKCLVHGGRGFALGFVVFLLPSMIGAPRRRTLKFAALAAGLLLAAGVIWEIRSAESGIVHQASTMISRTGEINTGDLIGAVSTLESNTATFWIATYDRPPHAGRAAWRLISPLPSFVVHQDPRFTNVMIYLNLDRNGQWGCPFPLLGELYFFGGWPSLVVWLAAGILAGWLYQNAEAAILGFGSQPLLWAMLYAAVPLAMAMSLFFGIRGSTRYPLWAAVWYFACAACSKILDAAASRGNRAAPEVA